MIAALQGCVAVQVPNGRAPHVADRCRPLYRLHGHQDRPIRRRRMARTNNRGFANLAKASEERRAPATYMLPWPIQRPTASRIYIERIGGPDTIRTRDLRP